MFVECVLQARGSNNVGEPTQVGKQYLLDRISGARTLFKAIAIEYRCCASTYNIERPKYVRTQVQLQVRFVASVPYSSRS